jgi:hypothetical protein
MIAVTVDSDLHDLLLTCARFRAGYAPGIICVPEQASFRLIVLGDSSATGCAAQVAVRPDGVDLLLLTLPSNLLFARNYQGRQVCCLERRLAGAYVRAAFSHGFLASGRSDCRLRPSGPCAVDCRTQ